LRERAQNDRHFFVARAELLLQAVPADGTEISLDMHAEHLLELAAQVARQQMQRFLLHRGALDRIHRTELLEAALQALDEGALARADRPHQIEHLSALLSFESGGGGRAAALAHLLRAAEWK